MTRKPDCFPNCISQHRNWFFTLNNPTGPISWEDRPAQVHFLKYSLEKGDSGTPHFQGWFQTTRSSRHAYCLKWTKFSFLTECHNPEAADRYVQKPETHIDGPWEFGYRSEQGKPNDLAIALEKVRNGASARQIAEEHPTTYCRNHNGIDKIISMQVLCEPTGHDLASFTAKPLDLSLPVLLWGPPLLGKTHFAMAHFKHAMFITHLDQLRGLDSSYDGLVFNDLDFSEEPFDKRRNLIEMDFSTFVNIKFGAARIPKGLPRIFTGHRPDLLLGLNDHSWERESLKRRVSYIEVTEKLFSTPPIPDAICPEKEDI